jgi:predicted small secreted protein
MRISFERKTTIIIVSLLVSVALAACSTAEVTPGPDIAATETAQAMAVAATATPAPTATPTKVPTAVPTATPTKVPTAPPTMQPTAVPTSPASPIGTPTGAATGGLDLSGAVLTLQDLPAGFVTVPSSLLGLENLSIPEAGGVVVPEHVFAFLDQTQFRVVAGFVQELPNQEAILAFDQAITPTMQLFLQGLSSGLGMQTEVNYQLQEMTGLEGIGNAAAGATTTIESQQASLQVDVIVFRREQVEAVLMVLYPQGLGQGLSPTGLAETLDQRIEAVLPTP